MAKITRTKSRHRKKKISKRVSKKRVLRRPKQKNARARYQPLYSRPLRDEALPDGYIYNRTSKRVTFGRGRKVKLSRTGYKKIKRYLSEAIKRSHLRTGRPEYHEISAQIRYTDSNGKSRIRWINKNFYSSPEFPEELDQFLESELSTGTKYTQFDQDGNIVKEWSLDSGVVSQLKYESLTIVKDTKEARKSGYKKVKTARRKKSRRKARRVRHRK